MLTGSLGMLPSASLGDGSGARPVRARARLGARHRRHRASANPLAMFGSVALMLRHGLAMENEAAALESAVDPRARGWPPDSGPGRRRTNRGRHPGGPRQPLGAPCSEHRGPHLAERRVRRLGGREGTRTHPLLALRHGGLRGRSAPTRPPRAAPPSSATRTTSTGSSSSAKLYYMDLPFSPAELREVTHELIVRNGFKSCYIRPLVYRGYGPMGLNPLKNPVEAMIAVWEWAPYLGEKGKREGVRARVSSYRRISSDSLIPHAKASGQYLNSVLAKIESLKAGYEEAILLDDKGNVCEGSGENVFVVKDGSDHDAAPGGGDPRRDQPQVVHADRARPRLRGDRARPRPRRAGARRRGLPHRDRRRAHAARRDRRHHDRRRRARPDHARDPGRLRGRLCAAATPATRTGSIWCRSRRAA